MTKPATPREYVEKLCDANTKLYNDWLTERNNKSIERAFMRLEIEQRRARIARRLER